MTMSRSLNEVVTSVAGELMAADVETAAGSVTTVLADLANYLSLDVAFLRHNDHTIAHDQSDRPVADPRT